MNVCPVLPTVARPARQGVLDGDDDAVNGLGRFKLGRALRPRLLPGPHELLMRKRRHHRRLARGIVSRPAIMAPRTALVPVGVSGDGYDDAVNGLGFSFKKLGKKLSKVAHSKLFKYAAIGAATYFTAGAAAPLLSKLGSKGGLFKSIGGAFKGALPAAAKAYGAAQGVQPVPGSAAAPFGATDFGQYGGYAGGGGYGGGSAGYGTSAGGGYDANAGAPEEQAAGFGAGVPGWVVPVAIGGVVLFALTRRGRGR